MEIFRNIFTNKFYLTLTFFVSLICLLTPAFIQYKFLPNYKMKIINETLVEANIIANDIFKKTNYFSLDIENINRLFNSEIYNLNIYKLKYYNDNGELIYSTGKEVVGSLCNDSFFYNKVKEGQIVYSLKEKNDLTSNTLLEVYVPLIKDNSFIFALSLNYNNKFEFYDFVTQMMYIIYLMIFILYLFFLFLIYDASKNNLYLNMKHKQLKQMAHRDTLTSLYNRKYFYSIASKIFDVSIRNNKKSSVAMVDIDNFRLINETYGHVVGDYILKELSKKLKELTRKSDLVARYGGEEFVLFLPETDILGANILASKICKEISKSSFSYNETKIQFTVSIGISQYKFGHLLNDLIEESEKALTLAKRRGKNKVERQ